jgi:hypothetical protein
MITQKQLHIEEITVDELRHLIRDEIHNAYVAYATIKKHEQKTTIISDSDIGAENLKYFKAKSIRFIEELKVKYGSKKIDLSSEVVRKLRFKHKITELAALLLRFEKKKIVRIYRNEHNHLTHIELL